MPSSPRVLLVAPDRSYRTGAYVRAAKDLRIELTVASWGRHPLVIDSKGIRLDPESADHAIAQIQQAAAQNPFSAVIATDDATVPLVRGICKRLGLPANGPRAFGASTDKAAFRAACVEQGLPSPAFFVVRPDKPAAPCFERVGFPCVAKPLSLSASRGVIRCDTQEELLSAVERIRQLLVEQDPKADQTILVEEYLPGKEYSVEALLHDGQLEVLAIFEKPEPMTGPFFEETIYVTPPQLDGDRLASIRTALTEMAVALEFREGPLHAELRISQAGISFIEVASRTIGGRCGKLIEFLTGASLEAWVLANAVRRPIRPRNSEDAFGVMMIPVPKAGVLRRVEGISKARKVKGIVSVEVDAREGQKLTPWPEGGPYPGFIFSRGTSAVEAASALRAAHDELVFVTAPKFSVKVT